MPVALPSKEQALESLEECPACGSSEFGHRLDAKSRYSDAWYRYCECGRCGLVFVNPRIPEGTVHEYVANRGGLEHGHLRHSKFDAYEFRRNILRTVLRHLDGGCRGKRWLDVGCAVGTLLDEVSREGFEAHGLELNARMAEWVAENRPHIGITNGTFSDLPDQLMFDVVSADNVFEHVHSPRPFLVEARHRLASGGLLLVRVPNFNTVARYASEWLGKLDASYITDPDAHPVNYCKASLVRVVSSQGFEVLHASSALSFSYPLRHLLGNAAARRKRWEPFLYRAFQACALFDNIIPAGGIDVVIVARKKAG